MTRVVSENRVLAMVLALLCLVAVVLAGFVVVGVNKSDDVKIADEVGIIEDENTDYERNEYLEYIKNFNDVEARVQELLSSEPIDVQAIMDLYAVNIDRLMVMEDYGRAYAFVTAEKDALISKGFEREALEALTRVDYSAMTEPAQYRRYQEIIELAERLGDGETVAKYQPLAEGTKEAYDLNYAATEAKKAESEANRGEYVQGGDIK